MNSVIIIPALLLGLASSLHCVGMCGPLSMSVPVGGEDRKMLQLYLYQAGRIITYILIGLIAGVLGRGILLAGYQQTLSIVMGLAVMIIAIGFYLGKKGSSLPFLNDYYLFVSKLVFKGMKRAAKPGGAFLFGMANGLLPCGMVYIAALSSISFGNSYYSGLFMLFFGMGTLPAMLLIAIAGKRIGRRRWPWLSQLTPVIVIVMGILLVVRGLNLDIPYLSPVFSVHTGEALSCH